MVVFCEKGVLREFAKFTPVPKSLFTLCRSLSLGQQLYQNEAPTQVFFSVNIVKFLRTGFCTEHFRCVYGL